MALDLWLGNFVGALEAAWHDVIWAGNWPEDTDEREFMGLAHRERLSFIFCYLPGFLLR